MIVFQGVIILQNIDVDAMEHIWMKKMDYGRMMWRVEAFARKLTILCMEIDIIAEPI